MNILIVIVGLIAAASAKNLTIGSGGGALVFEQNATASPAIWRQQNRIFVNVSDSEVITQVVVVDKREDQNGEASIVEGGVGHKNVTIELKSPTVLRGYDFEIQVYASQDDGVQKPVDNNQQSVQNQQNVQDQQDVQGTLGQATVGQDTVDQIYNDNKQVTKVPSVSTTSTEKPDGQQVVQHPIEVNDNGQQQLRPNRHTTQQEIEQKPVVAVVVPDDVQTNKDNKDFSEVQVQDNKGLDVQEGSLHVEPKKPADGSDDVQQSNVDVQVPVSTTKKTTDVNAQQTEKSVQIPQEVQVQNKLPLPYVTEKSIQSQKPLDIQQAEVQQVKTL